MPALLLAFVFLSLVGITAYSCMRLIEAQRERDAAHERAAIAESEAAEKVAEIEGRL